MKKLLLFFFMLTVANIALAQAPLQLNFQGVARNAQGNALANQNIKVRLSIHDLTPTGAVVYTETRVTTTNIVGVFNLIIGSKGATNVSGTILGVNWGLGNKFLQLEFDPSGNGAFVDLGTTQFQSVPYALNAYTATPIGEAGGDLNGYYPRPTIANNAINASKIANLSITDIKIVGISGAKVAGDIKGSAGNVTGIVAITNGGTGATTVSAAKQNFGLNNVDNTKDLDKPVSLATKAFLSSKLSILDTAAMLAPYKKATISQNLLSTKLSILDTAAMLAPYKKATISQNLLSTKLNILDTAAMLAPYKKAIISQNLLNTKLNISDTLLMLRTYAKAASVSLKAPLNSPSFTGTVSGITSTMVGLGNVDNTSDANKPISTATQNALNTTNSDLALKAPLASPTFTGTVSGINSVMVGLGNVDNTSDASKPVSTATQTALDLKASNIDLSLKAPLASPTFTGTVSGITSTMVGLGNVDNTSDLNKPISTATQNALNTTNSDLALKAPLASPTFTGTVSGITSTMVGLGNVDNTSDLNKPISTASQTALALKASNTDLSLKAPLESPTFTGTVSGITSTMVGLGDVDNTSDLNKPISTATQTALALKASNTDLSLKAPLASPTFTGTVSGITSTMVGLGNVDNTSDLNKPISTATQTALNTTNSDLALKAPLASPTFTGTVSGITSTMVGLGDVDNTSDLNKPISTATQTALALKASNTDLSLKAPLASPTFTGTVSGITSTMVGLGNVDNTSDLNKPISTATQTALALKASNSDLALKAPLASPTFTGTVSGISSTMVGLGNVDNTSDANKPISTATQTALALKASSIDLALKAPLESPTFTGTVSGITSTMVGLGDVDNTSDANKPISTATQTALALKASNSDLALKAPLASPTFTGTVSGITSTMVGLGNVDNTSDLNKPISTATQTALALKASSIDLSLKAPLESPTFTGTVSGITSTMVGLGNVDNTSDANKPISTATQTALALKASSIDLALKAPLESPTFTGTVSGITSTMVGLGNVDNTSDGNKPISTATQTALNSKASSIDLALKAPLASPTFTGTVSGITSTMVGLGNVNNTNDASKPVSTATQTALDLKAPLASPTFTGTLTASTIVKSGGTSAQYLMADGSVSTGAAAIREVADEFSATASQTSFTLTQTPSANSKVKMYINGIRISNTAYSVSGTTLTYNPTNNGAYALSASDRIQFDYYY